MQKEQIKAGWGAYRIGLVIDPESKKNKKRKQENGIVKIADLTV